MSDAKPKPSADHIETATDPAAFAHWPAGLRDEMLEHADNGCVGSILVSETDRVRIWQFRIGPGERSPFHRHVNPYFWTIFTAGKGRAYYSSGEIRDVTFYQGETMHFYYGPGEYKLHMVENTGDTELQFCTVEFLDGTNEPLPVPDKIRMSPKQPD